MSVSTVYDVIIIGAGISGLAAAKVLSMEGLKTVVLEARPRNGGRIHTIHLPTNSNATAAVDLGASYLHGCTNSQDVQPLFRLADRLKMPTVTAPGDVLGPHRGWECPEVAMWRDQDSGEKIELSEIAEMSFLLDRCLVYLLMLKNPQNKGTTCKVDRRTLSSGLSTSLSACLRLLHDAGQRTSATLSAREQAIFDSLLARYIAFVNPPHRLPLKLPLGSHYESDAAAGSANNPDQPSATAKQMYVDWLEKKRSHIEAHGPKITVAKRVEHQWEDRLVLQGFDKIIEFLANGLDIRQSCVVRRVDWQDVAIVTRPITGYSRDRDRRSLVHVEFCHAPFSGLDKKEAAALARRSTLERYSARYCLVTVPVGVLKGLDRRSSIVFNPVLPAFKRDAISRLSLPRVGAETHNKVILQFRPEEAFWDRSSPQLVCPGARLHVLNADFYGCPGVLVAHLWAGSALRMSPSRPDALVVQELLDILYGMYPSCKPPPRPVFTHVTRWSEDPFSLGAYTTGEVGSGDVDRHNYAASLPSKEHPRLLFAGEGTVDSSGGQQCTHGAFLSGIERAIDILEHAHDGSRSRLRDVRIIDYMTGGSRRQPHYPRHGMVRRAMKHKLVMPRDDLSSCRQATPNRQPRMDASQNSPSRSTSVDQPKRDKANDFLTDLGSVNSSQAAGEDHPDPSDPTDSNTCRRSCRTLTWVSSQASVSLFKSRQGSSDSPRRLVTRIKQCRSSASASLSSANTSAASLASSRGDEAEREDLTSSSSPLVVSSPEFDSDAEEEPPGDHQPADPSYCPPQAAGHSKQHTRLAVPPPPSESTGATDEDRCRQLDSLDQLERQRLLLLLPTGLVPTRSNADVRFGSPPVFRPPLPPRIASGLSRRDSVESQLLWSRATAGAAPPAFGNLAFPDGAGQGGVSGLQAVGKSGDRLAAQGAGT